MITRAQIHGDRWLAGRVMRYHTWPVLQKQTTRDHSCRALQIYVEIFGMPRGEVLYWISWHDGGEQFAGDAPFGGKRSVPGLQEKLNEAENLGLGMLRIGMPNLTADEYAKAKICDLLEMYEFAVAEMNLGNKYAEVMASNTYTAAMAAAQKVDVFVDVEKWTREHY